MKYPAHTLDERQQSFYKMRWDEMNCPSRLGYWAMRDPTIFLWLDEMNRSCLGQWAIRDEGLHSQEKKVHPNSWHCRTYANECSSLKVTARVSRADRQRHERPPIWLVTPRSRSGLCLKNTIISFKVWVMVLHCMLKQYIMLNSLCAESTVQLLQTALTKYDQICSSKACQWTSSLQLKKCTYVSHRAFSLSSNGLAASWLAASSPATTRDNGLENGRDVADSRADVIAFCPQSMWRICQLHLYQLLQISTMWLQEINCLHCIMQMQERRWNLHERARSSRAETILIITTFFKAIMPETLQHTQDPYHWSLNSVFVQHL